jgi:subfamily B ATP-binding cassette protein MsbA
MKFSLQDITATAGLPLLKRCIVAFKPYWKAVTLATLSMGVVAACTAAAAFLVKPALDDIFIEKNARALYLIPAAYVLVVICKGVFQYLQNLLMKRSGLLVLEDLRNALYDKIIGLPLTFFEENQVGMLMSRIINDVLLIRMSLPAVIMLVRQVLTMAGLLFVIFYRDWRLACWAMLVLPLARKRLLVMVSLPMDAPGETVPLVPGTT